MNALSKLKLMTLIVGALALLVVPGCPEEGDGEDGSGETKSDEGGGW